MRFCFIIFVVALPCSRAWVARTPRHTFARHRGCCSMVQSDRGAAKGLTLSLREGRAGDDPDADAEAAEAAFPVRRAKTQTVNQRLLAEIEGALAESGGLTPVAEPRPREETDLNGVNPLAALAGAGGAAAMSFGAWKATLFLTQAYYAHPVESDIYFVQRISGVLKQTIVGLGSLATGIFGVTALGMLLLSGRVLIGVVSGELDMNAEQTDVRRPSAGMESSPGEAPADPALGKASELLSRVEAEIQRETKRSGAD